MTDDLDSLEIDVVTITRDENDLVTVDGGGLTSEAISHLLLVAQHVHAEAWFKADEEADEPD